MQKQTGKLRGVKIMEIGTIAAAILSMAALCAASEAVTRSGAREMYAHGEEEVKALAEYVSLMPMEKRAAQLFLVNINGKESFAPVEDAVPGGYIFFAYNIADSKEGVRGFTRSIQAWCEKHGEVMPYLAVDEEGGEVERLRGVAAHLPSQQRVANTMTQDEAERLYRQVAGDMREMGFHLNLAPIAEATNERNKEMLGTRSFGSAENAAGYGARCVKAFASAGVACAIKHFPGNGAVDPHTGLAEISITRAEAEAEAMPFAHLIAAGAEAVVMSHARVHITDGEEEESADDVPACLSKRWVGELRERCGFGGLVVSDDIFMAALADNGYPPERAAEMAVMAGVDVIMLSDKRCGKMLSYVVRRAEEDDAFASRVAESCLRVMLFKKRHGVWSVK